MRPNELAQLAAAVRALASVCDGAREDDGRGFNGTDAKFGHRLAVLPVEHWTPEISRAAYEMLAKYRRQLAGFGIDYDRLPVPPDVAAEALADARQDARRRVRAIERGETPPPARVTVDAIDKHFVLRFPYNAELVARVRRFYRRRWHGEAKCWLVDAIPENVADLEAFIAATGAYLTPAAEDALFALQAHPRSRTPTRTIYLFDTRDPLRGDLIAIQGPPDPEAVALIRDTPNARWFDAPGVWTLPYTPEAAATCRKLIERGYVPQAGVPRVLASIEAEAQRADEAAAEMIAASQATSAEIDIPGLAGTLRPFQAAGVRYMLAVKRGFIADEMGLGKTIQALATIEGAGAYPAVIVCPASLKLNWLREARTWLPRRNIIVCDSRTRRAEIEYADVLITNYDVLRVREEKQEGTQKPLLVPEGLLALLIGRCPRAVVFDEFHYCKNPGARRTRAAALLAQGAEYRLGLTGTPILNRPNELIAPLKILGRLQDFGGYRGFIAEYCGGVKIKQVRGGRTIKDTSGATNLERLNKKLRATCYVRRLKRDVLKELPPKVRSMIELPIDNRDEYNRARADVVAWLGNRAAQEAEFLRSIAHLSPERQAELIRARRWSAEERAARAEHLVRIEALKQLAARGKLRSALDWVRNFLESGEKLVLFATHKDIVHALAEPWQAPVITGETPVPERQAAVDRFQNDPECRLIVLNLRAGGVGLTLTAASNVAFVELGWTPADHDQAEDRCHRIGQHDSVTAYYLLADRTIDIDIWELIEEKRRVVDQVADGKQQSILDDLTKRLLRRAAS